MRDMGLGKRIPISTSLFEQCEDFPEEECVSKLLIISILFISRICEVLYSIVKTYAYNSSLTV